MYKEHKLYSFVSISLIAAFIYQSAAFVPLQSSPPTSFGSVLASIVSSVTNLVSEKPRPTKVELKLERTANSKTFLNPNGTYTAEISQQDINYKDKDGQMRPIDTSLEKDTDGYKVDENSIQANFGDKANNLIQITNSEDNTSIDYKIADSEKTEISPTKKSDNKLTYENYKQDASLNYTIKEGQLKEEIVLDKPPADNTFTFELDLKNLKPKEQKDGSIYLLDEAKDNKNVNPKIRNKPSFIIETPFMQDSTLQDPSSPPSNISQDVDMQIKKKKDSIYTLKVTADKKWLDDPKRVYPVKIDPTFSVQQQTTLDTYISSDQNQQHIRAYEDKMYVGSNPNVPEHRALVKFDTSFIPKDANITSAKMYLTRAEIPDPKTVNLYPSQTSTTAYRITTDWNANITWNSMANNFATPWIGFPQANDIEHQEFDVTPMVQNWQNGFTQNYGLMLMSNPGLLIPFYTLEANIADQYKPRLVVTYQLNRLGRESYRTYKDFSGVSVDAQTGNAIVEATDVNIAGRGPATHISRIYNSQDSSSAQLRQGFSLNIDLLRASYNGTSTAIITTETGARHTYNLNADQVTFTRPSGVDDDLIIENGLLTLKSKDNSKIVFASDGRVSKEIDKNGNTLTYDYSTPYVTSITDALGRSTKIYYDSLNGTVNKIVDLAGRTTSFSYTWYTNGIILKVVATNPEGKNTTYNYGEQGKLSNFINPSGNPTAIDYDPEAEGKVTKVTNPLAKAMTFDYTLKDVEASRNLLVNSSFENDVNNWGRFGNIATATYPYPSIDPILGNYFLETNTTTVSDSLYQDYLVDPSNLLKEGDKYTFSIYVRSPQGVSITGNITLWGLWSAYTANSTWFTTSSKEWQRVSTTFTVANATSNTLRAQIHLFTAGAGYNFQFDGAQLEKNAFASSYSDNYTAPRPREVSYTTVTDPKGNKTTYYFNSEGLVSKVGEPIGATTSTDANEPYFPGDKVLVPRQVVTRVPVLPGNEENVELDLDDWAEEEFEDFEEEVEQQYVDVVQTVIDIVAVAHQEGQIPSPEVSQPLKEGTVTQYQYGDEYDPFHLVTVIEKDNTFITYKYDANGNKTEEKEHDHDYPENGSAATDTTKHRTTTYTYDPVTNNLLSQTSPTGQITSYEYGKNSVDEVGVPQEQKVNLVKEIGPYEAGNATNAPVTTYEYDNYGNQIKKIDPEGNKTLDPNDYTTTNTYDANNNLIQTTDATGVSTYYTYDELGNKIAEKKEGQDIIGSNYDNLGRVINQKSAANDKGFSLSKFSYAADGNKTKDETRVVNVETDQSLPWFNSSWQKRVSLSIDNTNNPQALTDYQVKLDIPYTTGMQPDFSDIFFTDTDKTTSIPYWIEKTISSTKATVWLKIPSIAASSAKTIYMYYGNSAATSASNGGAVFESFDIGAPKGYWKLNEASGTSAADETRANNGDIYGANHVSGKYNQALNFDSDTNANALWVDSGESAERIIVPSTTLGTASNQLTLAGWIKLGSTGQGHSLIEKWDSYGLRVETNQITVQLWGITYFQAPVNLSRNEWHQVTATYDGSLVKIYLNGQLIGQTQASGTIPTGTNQAWIGANYGGGQLTGAVDEVGIFDRVLSQNEIASLVGNQLQGMGSVYNIRKYSPVEPEVNIGTLKKYTTYTYDNANQLISQASYMSDNTLYVQTDFTYDDNGNKTKGKRLQKYDANNNAIYSTTTYEYDQLNRLTKETRPDSSWTAYKYDSFGNVTQEGTPEGTTANIYDRAGNQVATASSDGTVTKNIYDKEGNERIAGDAKDIATATNYDSNGNIVKVADANNQQTNYSYDANQNEKTVIAPDNTQTSTDYNQANQVVKEQDQNQQGTNNGTTTNYNASGQEQSIDQPNNQDQSMQYSNNGSLTDVSAAGATANSSDVTASYDASGNPKSVITDPAGSSQQQLTKVSTNYDDADRVSSTTDLLGSLISYNYDYLNNLTEITDSGRTTKYEYDTANKLTAIVDHDPTTNQDQTTSYAYEQGKLFEGTPNEATYNKSNISNISLPNGVQTNFAYDTGTKVTSVVNKTSSNDVLSSNNYTYDLNGNITNSIDRQSFSLFNDDFAVFNPLMWISGSTDNYYDSTNAQMVMQSKNWYNYNWQKRAPITINNTSNSQGLNNYQVKLTLAYGSGMKPDFSDLRFTDEDQISQLSYWIENYSASNTATVWVKVPQISANSSKTIYMYYANSSATSLSNGNDTFDLFNLTGIASSWRMNEEQGSSIVDEVGINNGIISGANWAPGKFNSALSFNGISSYAQLPTSAAFGASNNLTVSMWVNPADLSKSLSGILGAYGEQAFTHLHVDNNRKILGYFYGPNAYYYSNSQIPLNTWTLLTITYQNGVGTNVYLNGSLDWSSAPQSGTLTQTSSNLRLGDAWDNGRFFAGSIDDLKIFNRVLSASEITTIYNNYPQKMGSYYNVRKYSSIEPNVTVGSPTSYYPWYNELWQQRESITINNTDNSQDLNSYQVKLTIPYEAEMKTDFSDLRFTDEDQISELSYWVENKTDSNQATVWVKVPNINANSKKTIYMYYANPNALSASNGNNTFDYFNLQSPISSWQMDEAQGGVIADEAGANNASLFNTTWTSGKYNGGLGFNGINSYAQLPTSAAFGASNNLTISMWVNPADLSKSLSGILGPYGEQAFTHLHVDNNRKILGYFYGPNAYYYSNSQIPLNTWTLLTVTYQNGVGAKVYLNGSLDWASTPQSGALTQTTSNLRLGDAWDNGRFFNGSIDDLKIFNTTLSENEISAIYTNHIQKMGSYYNGGKYTSIKPTASIDTNSNTNNQGFYSSQTYNRSDYPSIKVDFKATNSNSFFDIAAEGLADGSYRKLALSYGPTAIKIQTEVGSKITYPATISVSNPTANTWYTASFDFSATDTKVYVYPKGSPKPDIPAYTFNSADWNPNLHFYNYTGSAYIDNVSISSNKPRQTNYTYDSLNRLINVANPDNSTVAYTYDEQGNRLTKTDSAGTTNYQYSAANELQSTTLGTNTTNYTYDANGNTLTKTEPGNQTTAYTYDNKNQLVKIVKPNADVIEYTYDGNGNRYSKTINGTASYYHYDTGGNIVSETDSNNNVLVRYVRDNTGKAISMIQGANTYYFIYNGHGDVTSLTDSSGNVVASYSYDEFGNITSSTGTAYNPLRYAGAHNGYYDTETGLYKMGVRYYQPDVGRWLTRDDYEGEQQQSQSQNRYVYGENNPVTKVDPTGYKAVKHSIKHTIKENYIDGAFWLDAYLYYTSYSDKNYFKITKLKNKWSLPGLRISAWVGPNEAEIKFKGKRKYKEKGKQYLYGVGLYPIKGQESFKINKRFKNKDKKSLDISDGVMFGYAAAAGKNSNGQIINFNL